MLPIRHSLPAWREADAAYRERHQHAAKGIGLALKAVGNMADRILAFPNQCGTPPANIFHPPDIRRTARWKSSFWESEF